MKKILIIIGTRPEAIKLIPVYFALRKRFKVILISTGQHKEMLQQIFDFFGVAPHHSLDVMKQRQSLPQITSLLFSELSKTLELERGDLVVVQGDTTTAMVGAMVSYYHKIPLAHVEAGLRSGNKYLPFPEEVNRRVITQIADLNFAPTFLAANNLGGFPNVHVVGNTVVDSLLLTLEKLGAPGSRLIRGISIPDGRKDLILVTAHRRESFGDGIRNICAAIRILAERYPLLYFIFPVHPNPNVKEKVLDMLEGVPFVHLIEPVKYDEMVDLMRRAKIILTDSGGIQEEAPSLGIPLVVMRDVTERPEGIDAGCALLAGTSTEGIVRAFESIYDYPERFETMRKAGNPYGDGRSSERIADIIINYL